MSVSDSFKKLLEKIQPLDGEIQAANGHIATIKACLSEAFDSPKYLITGSASRGTFIRGKSDIDLFVVVKRDNARWGKHYKLSSTVLNNFIWVLKKRFWQTHIYKDVHAAVVDFADCRVDVVPAFFDGMADNNWPLFSMPDGKGGWLQTSPDLYKAYISKADKESRGKLKYTAQLMKYWRECRTPRKPLSSFYIEMVLASEGICAGVKSYSECVAELLQNLAGRGCRAMHDPFSISGNIQCVPTESQRLLTLASIKASRDHAKKACIWESSSVLHAKYQWRFVFNGQFPR